MKLSSALLGPGVRLRIKHQGELRILGIGDTHFPFVDHKKLKEVYRLAKYLQPTHIVQVGDLYDMYSFSRFSRSLDLMTPKTEIEMGRKMSLEMWATINRLCPSAKKYQLRGNHSDRIWKSIMAVAPQYEPLLMAPINKLFDYEGVLSFQDSRCELVINDIVFHHGWKTTIGDHARYYGQSAVCGHLHRGGVVFFPMKGKPIFELNCGFIADIDRLPLQYGETKTSSWVAGAGVIDKHGPRFIPL